MKKLLACTLALVLLLAMIPSTTAAEPGLANFKRTRSYTPGMFSDVAQGAWYEEGVSTAYEFGLVNGSGDGAYSPDGSITLGSVLALASRLHHIYNGGDGVFTQGTPWYQVYVDYAAAAGIYRLSPDEGCGDVVTRAQFAHILAHALPAAALEEINQVVDNGIPDLPATHPSAYEIYTLYRAGILTGSDAAGSFEPDASIGRSSVAAIVSRMADPAVRKNITLTQEKFLFVFPEMATVPKGGTQVFTTAGSDMESLDVTWSLKGQKSAGTVIAPDGTLTVGTDETAGQFLVVAALQSDPAVKRTATVTVGGSGGAAPAPTDGPGGPEEPGGPEGPGTPGGPEDPGSSDGPGKPGSATPPDDGGPDGPGSGEEDNTAGCPHDLDIVLEGYRYPSGYIIEVSDPLTFMGHKFKNYTLEPDFAASFKVTCPGCHQEFPVEVHGVMETYEGKTEESRNQNGEVSTYVYLHAHLVITMKVLGHEYVTEQMNQSQRHCVSGPGAPNCSCRK